MTTHSLILASLLAAIMKSWVKLSILASVMSGPFHSTWSRSVSLIATKTRKNKGTTNERNHQKLIKGREERKVRKKGMNKQTKKEKR